MTTVADIPGWERYVKEHGGKAGGELTGPAIAKAVEFGLIEIDPFDQAQVAECSYDVRLGDTYLTYPGDVLDVREKAEAHVYPIPKTGLLLWPHELYLMSTVERFSTNYFKPRIDGKSSIARFGVQVHLTAGAGEPGFDGQWTLEVVVPHVRRVRIYPGMLIGQMSFTTLVGEVRLYDGNYKGETSRGPQPSRSWNQPR